MELNSNSWQAKLYKWYFRKPLPNNICEYFWMLVLLYTTIVQYTIIALPALIRELFVTEKIKYWGRLLNSFGICLLITSVICIFTPIVAIWAGWPEHGSWWQIAAGFGCVIYAIAAILFIGYLVTIYETYRLEKPKQPSVIKEWIKAKKGKYCTPITWK